MRCEENGVLIRDPEAGGFPSTYWVADLWRCPVCGHEINQGRSKELTEEQARRHGYSADQALEFRYNTSQEEEAKCRDFPKTIG
jgi:hypothetical protein